MVTAPFRFYAYLSNGLTWMGNTVKISRFPGFEYRWGTQMYAVIKTGGKQYRVCAGDKLKIEKLEAEIGSEVTFDQVLMIGDGDNVKVGGPMLAGAMVKATVLNQARGDKIHIFKMRRRKHYRKSQGHRQYFNEVQIGGITA